MDEPLLLLQYAIDCFAIDQEAIPEPQLHPKAAISKCGMLLNPIMQALDPRGIGARTTPLDPTPPEQLCPVDA
jgi:hypothetical protein